MEYHSKYIIEENGKRPDNQNPAIEKTNIRYNKSKPLKIGRRNNYKGYFNNLVYAKTNNLNTNTGITKRARIFFFGRQDFGNKPIIYGS